MLEQVIEPACAAVGIVPIRADRLPRPGDITEQVFRALRDADIVIADVTDANPNVMYELGLRHTTDLLTIQLGVTDRLPFDLNSIRTIQFPRSNEGFQRGREILVAALRAGLAGAFDPVVATRLWLEVWPKQRRVLASEPPGALERVPEMMAALRRMRDSWVLQVESVVATVAEVANRLRAEKEKLDVAQAVAERYEPIKTETALALKELADRSEALEEELRHDVKAVLYGIEHLTLKFTKNIFDPEIQESKWIPKLLNEIVAFTRAGAGNVERPMKR